MKCFLTLIACCVVSLANVTAQSVSVEIVLDHDQYLVNEDIDVKVRITNFSGQTLTFGTEPDWLSFSVEGGPNKVVSQRSVVSAPGEFKLDSSTIGTRRLNLAPHFDLSRPGRYSVTAFVRIPQLNTRVQCKAKAFNIITGTVLWQQDFGVPTDVKTTNRPPEIRKYSLLQVSHEKDLKLYFRLSDATATRNYHVFPIGNLISFSNPEGQLDRFNNLHLLYQTGARSFLYTVINPDGVMFSRETHDISTSRPALRAEKEGRIALTGGTRRYTTTDLPPTIDVETTANAAPREP